MGANFYISVDRSTAPAWPFTEQQLARAVQRRWPESASATVPGEVLEVDVRVGDEHCEITYHYDRQFFTFPDQEPLRVPVVIIHTLLRDLAPTTPAVWWADYDGTPEPFDVQADAEQVAEDFGM
ncbi:hypothetical protein ACFVT9_37280 [Kitasatospora cineracea]|uniref:hypothetical protein n=1 Tax=Kitasatospora cineracea TaxID=88074 RepID=UPI0036D87A71